MRQKRRILFVISCFRVSNTGNGGHYHSLRTVAEALAQTGEDVRIVSVGDFAPPAMQGVAVDYRHIGAGRFGVQAAATLFDPSPTHVHAFDRRAVFFARAFAKRHHANLYVTKPGGPNKTYHPFAEDIFTFSRENLDWLQADPRLGSARLHFAPQRVAPALIDEDRLAKLRTIYPYSGVTVLRIARIGPYYRRSIDMTLALAGSLRDQGHQARALIIGTPDHSGTVAELESSVTGPDIVCTSPEFTKLAARLLPIADLVVGTGRGLMEAMIAGIPTLCPVSDRTRPILVTAENLDRLQATNFSERSLSTPADDDGLEAVARLLGHTPNWNDAVECSRSIASSNFDVRAALPIYRLAYEAPQVGRRTLLDTVVLTGGAMYAGLRRGAAPGTGEALTEPG